MARGRPEKRDEYLRTLQRESGRLENLIEDLLDLSRLDLQAAFHLEPVDLNGWSLGK
ncbi:MAG: histidine kinase dimerization/phospho-acceptor domain-containing protein [Anaerolineae bacterium]